MQMRNSGIKSIAVAAGLAMVTGLSSAAMAASVTDSGAGWNPARDTNFSWARARHGNGSWQVGVDPDGRSEDAGVRDTAGATLPNNEFFDFQLTWDAASTPSFSFQAADSDVVTVEPAGVDPFTGPKTIFTQINLTEEQSIEVRDLQINGEAVTGGDMAVDRSGGSGNQFNWWEIDLDDAGGGEFESLTGRMKFFTPESSDVRGNRPGVTFEFVDASVESAPTPGAATAGLLLLGGLAMRRRRSVR